MNYHILLATDYSEGVMNAERYALELAKKSSAALRMIHVYDIPFTSTPINPVEFAKTRSDYRKAAFKILKQRRWSILHALHSSESDYRIECIVREGNPGKQICKEANEETTDMIVVGAHAATGLRETLFGTHTWNVMRKAPSPVLAVPFDARFTGIRHVIFATGLHENQVPVLNYLVHLLRGFQPEITAHYVCDKNIPIETQAELFASFRKDLKDHIAYPKLKITNGRYDDEVEGINAYCQSTQADWLAMSREKPSLLERIVRPEYSALKKMSMHSRLPVLVIPEMPVLAETEIAQNELEEQKLYERYGI